MKSLKTNPWSLSISAAIIVVCSVSFALAWTGPAQTAPSGNIDTPINITATGQVKSGGFWAAAVGSDTGYCIGASCIFAWPNILWTVSTTTTGIYYTGGNVGIGTVSPVATIDINGYAHLAIQTSAPFVCDALHTGAITISGTASICTCNGSSWIADASGAVCAWIDTTPPTVSITAPLNGATVSGSATSITATASDNVGVTGVQFKLDGANLGPLDTASPYAYSWDTTATANGSHTLTAVASDEVGNTTISAPVSVTVSHTWTWTQRTAAGSRKWLSVTSSSDGARLAAGVLINDIYTSADSGATWTDQTAAGSRDWRSITSSADGTHLAAAVRVGDIYTSADSGATWTDRTSAKGSLGWLSITSSSDGTHLAACVGNTSGDIYTSVDGGATWTDRTSAGSRVWFSITSSSDGTHLATVVSVGDIYTSADGGATWTDRTSAGSRDWRSITSSADGTRLAAVVSGGDIYTSADGGATWTDRTSAGSRDWRSITSSSDGTRLAAAVRGGDIYTSADSGATWTDQTAAGSRSWSSITSSSDGTHLAAVVDNGGYIWTGVFQ